MPTSLHHLHRMLIDKRPHCTYTLSQSKSDFTTVAPYQHFSEHYSHQNRATNASLRLPIESATLGNCRPDLATRTLTQNAHLQSPRPATDPVQGHGSRHSWTSVFLRSPIDMFGTLSHDRSRSGLPIYLSVWTRGSASWAWPRWKIRLGTDEAACWLGPWRPKSKMHGWMGLRVGWDIRYFLSDRSRDREGGREGEDEDEAVLFRLGNVV